MEYMMQSYYLSFATAINSRYSDGENVSDTMNAQTRSKYMQVVRWQEATKPDEQELCRRMQQQGLSPYSWSNGPGDTYAVHSHSYEKVLYCVRGSIRFVLPDQPE